MTQILTLEEQTDTIARYLPSGDAFDAVYVDDAKSRDLLRGLAEELIRMDEALRLFRDHIVPDTTEHFIPEWESAVGIPDDCFPGTGTDAERRRDVVVKLASSGVQTSSDFVALAAIFGVVLTVIPGKVAELEPTISFPDDKTARNTIVVNFGLDPGTGFPYTFPFTFGSPEVGIIQCLFTKLKPATSDILFTSF